jgi:hypothetical protein
MSTDLKIAGPITDATTTTNAAGRVGKLMLTTPAAPASVGAATARAELGLRSTWFTVGVMSLAAPVPATPLQYGLPLTLLGVLRGVTGATLEQRVSGGTWQPVGPVSPGALKLTQRPTITTDYRLATTTAASAFVRIRVAPAVTATSLTTTGIAGSEQPVLAGAPVSIEQQNADLSWTGVAGGAVNADGTFSIPASLTSGATYRITVGPATGYAAGSTTPQIVAR